MMDVRINVNIAAAVVVVTLAAALPGLVWAAEAGEDELANRLAMVRTLLFDSSAAQRITASDSAEAQEKHREAVQLFESASLPGDSVAREAQLKRAVELLYQASAAVPNSPSAEAKGRRDFDRKRLSLDALLEAHDRIMQEKGTTQLHAALLDVIEPDVRAAESLLAAGDIDQARDRLDRAYDSTRIAVENSRMGETLKRELKFDTPEDEYRYELDRNETHRMLLTVLLDEKMKDERIRGKVDGFVEVADKHRAVADDLARQQRFEDAIKELERSTAELVKAIRGAGVYIPS